MNVFESHHDNKSLCFLVVCCFEGSKKGVKELSGGGCFVPFGFCFMQQLLIVQLHRKVINRKRNSRTKGAIVRVPKCHRQKGDSNNVLKRREIEYRIYMHEKKEQSNTHALRILMSWKSNEVSFFFSFQISQFLL